jgi:predicted DNA-binding antitoxin AbrB/MazE fold protein
MKMNMNDFAREVTLEEGKKRQVSIAQVKEILRITFTKLSEEPENEVLKVMKRYKR